MLLNFVQSVVMRYLTLAFLFIAVFIIIGLMQVGESTAPVILEPPQNQYVLVGTNFTFTCNTRGHNAYWVLNDTAITITHQSAQSMYERLGVLFTNTSIGGYYNLTMCAAATVVWNNTEIVCSVRGEKLIRVAQTTPVYLYVFNSLRPYPPDVIIKVMYSNLIGSLPVIYATMTIYPRTPVYDISEFKMIITNASDGSILNQTMIPSSYGNNTSTVDVHELLPHSLSYGCTKLRLTVTVASDMYGESNPTERDVMIFKSLKLSSVKFLNHTVLFYSNGALFNVSLQLQLDVCHHQLVNYTLLVEEDGHSTTADIMINASYYHEGPGNISHSVVGLRKDHSYSVKARVNSLIWVNESKRYYFDTKLHVEPLAIGGILQPTSSTTVVVNGLIYVIALGVALLVVLLVLVAISVMFMYFCIHTKSSRVHSKPQSSPPSNRSMVDNPIYDGPVYEIVTAVSQDDVSIATPIPTDHHKHSPVPMHSLPHSPLPLHYVDEPTEARAHRKVTSTDSYDHLTTTHKANRSTKPAADTEESFTLMNPANTLTGHY